MARFSIQRIGEATGRTARRFPLVLLSAVLAGICAVILVKLEGDAPRLLNTMLVAQLGIPTLLVTALVCERRQMWRWPAFATLLAAGIALVLLTAYGLSLPLDWREVDIIRFVQLNVGMHLLVALAPFLRGHETNGFWQFNLNLALRFVNAAFFSAVLFAGLAVALLALDNLLGLDVDDDLYLQMWALIAFVFNTSYLLGGVPPQLADLERRDERPRVVRIFAQNILAPLVAVYLAILLAYLVKVVATAEWPSGWIGWLVSSVAMAGLLSLLLLHPELRGERGRWVRFYARTFHVLMVPAVVMLALAIGKRIGQYGFTEMRYFLAVLTGWLAVVVVVGCFRRTPLLRAIPASLAAVAFVTLIGPWSASSVTYHSQLGRLQDQLSVHGLIDGGVMVPGETEIPESEIGALCRQLIYLLDHFGPQALGDLADPELVEKLAAADAEHTHRHATGRELARVTTDYLGLPFVEISRVQTIAGHHHVERDRQPGIPAIAVSGYDHLLQVFLSGDESITTRLGADSCSVRLDWSAPAITIRRAPADTIVIMLAETVARLRAHHEAHGQATAPDSLLAAWSTGDDRRAMLRLDMLSWQDADDGSIDSGQLRGQLLIADREPWPSARGSMPR